MPRAQVCDPVCDTGCNGGRRCDITQTPSRGGCVPTGTGAPGQTCAVTSSGDSCGARATCLANGLCYGLCYVDTDCGGNLCCNISITLGASQTASGFFACSPSVRCDPTATGAGPCGVGNACYLLPCTTNTSNTACGQAGTRTRGQSCMFANDCAAGLDCVGSPAACQTTCVLANPICPQGTTCSAVPIDPGPPPLVSTVYGVCL
jgi:hypothetical protein